MGIYMQVEISRRRFLQGSVALSVVGGSATTFSTLLAEDRKSLLANTKVATVCEMCVNKCAAFASVENGILKN